MVLEHGVLDLDPTNLKLKILILLIITFAYTHMDFMTPPMFNILNFPTWKVKISMYLKALGIQVYFATIKDSYFLNGKNLYVNAKALHALKSTLNDDYLSRVSNIESAFVVWNTLFSLGD